MKDEGWRVRVEGWRLKVEGWGLRVEGWMKKGEGGGDVKKLILKGLGGFVDGLTNGHLW